jgi:hypothetical protein
VPDSSTNHQAAGGRSGQDEAAMLMVSRLASISYLFQIRLTALI